MGFITKGSTREDLGVLPQRVVGIYQFKGTPWYVDGEKGTKGSGRSWASAFDTPQKAVDACAAGDTILIADLPGDASAGDTDPDSYTSTIDIPATKNGISLIGVSRGLSQGTQPSLRPGPGPTPITPVNAFGVPSRCRDGAR